MTIRDKEEEIMNEEMEVGQICHAQCLSLQVIKNPILTIWARIPSGIHKEKVCSICGERLLPEHAVFIEKIEFNFIQGGLNE